MNHGAIINIEDVEASIPLGILSYVRTNNAELVVGNILGPQKCLYYKLIYEPDCLVYRVVHVVFFFLDPNLDLTLLTLFSLLLHLRLFELGTLLRTARYGALFRCLARGCRLSLVGTI